MAKVAAAGPIAPSNAFHMGGGSRVTLPNLKRKTPSELRGELLKRKNATEIVDESPYPVPDSVKIAEKLVNMSKKGLPKAPRYVDTRLNDLFPVRKNCIRPPLLNEKEISKEKTPVQCNSSIEDPSISANLASGRQQQHFSKIQTIKGCNAAEKSNKSSFRSVSELSLGGENLSALSNIDMDKALKGLVAHDLQTAALLAGRSRGTSDMTSQCHFTEFNTNSRKAPLDLTLKTSMRVLSSSSVNWFHRLVNCSSFCHNFQPDERSSSSKPASCTSRSSPRGFASWQYPQSPLPASVISAITLAEGEGQIGFLRNRQEAWEDSFRGLYYMFRKRKCNIFYVCATQFVVMFTAYDVPNEAKLRCNAYISQSTRGLRSLLKEHDVCFSMPLYHSKAKEVVTEDLDGAEIEKDNYCQDQYFTDVSDMDYTPQSLLAFAGNGRVHALYDFLLNYRYFLISLSGMDVPILYSPVPFQNAALSVPEVRCKEVRRADYMHLPQESYGIGEASAGSSPGICYSVEIKAAYLPPWTVGSICDAIGSDGTNFEASFTTDRSSTGLNVGLDVINHDLNPEMTTEVQTRDHVFGMKNFTYAHPLRSAYLKGLKCSGDAYTASISRI